MTISNTIRTAGPFIGNDVTTAFPFYFKIFKTTDLLAVQTDVASGVATSLVLNSGYTVTLNPDQNASPGGTATLPAALATGKTLVLTSDLAYLQPLDITNGGGFYPSVINAALDRLTIFCQQLFSLARRSLKLPLSDIGMNTELPSAAARANKLLGFDANGLPIVVAPVSGSAAEVAIALANAISAYLSSIGSSLIGYIQAGLGAVGWSVQDKLRESVTLTDFMTAAERADALTGTPTIDIIVALEKAYAASNVLIVPPGNYLLSRAFKINKNNYSVLGAGYNRSIFTMTAASTVAIEVAGEANVTGLRLSDFKIQGNATNIGGIKLGSASFYCAIPIFENLNIWDFSLSAGTNGYGIQLYQVQNATFHNCWVYRNRHAYQRPNAGYCTSTKISGKSSYAGQGYIGIYIDGQIDDIYVDDVVLEGNENSAIIITPNAVQPIRGTALYMNGCYLEANNDVGAGVITANGGSGLYQAHVVTIDRCNFAVNTGNYINFDRVIGKVKNNRVTPQQTVTTANTICDFQDNYHTTAADFFVGYRALLGNITVLDKNSAATSTIPNQCNFMNGITFPNVPRLVSDPNTIDDYQERVSGQWVPTATGFGGSITTLAGQYVKIGRMVHLQISISGTGLSSAYGTTGISIPFNANLATSGSIFNGTSGTSVGGVYLDASTDKILIPTIAAANAVYLINVSYVADE